MNYIQGAILAVPAKNREAYRKHSETMASIVRDAGALKFVECWGVDVPEGEVTSFPKAVQCKEDEVVVFSWIVWESKEACDAGQKTIHEKARAHFGDMSQIFDTKRMVFGGFQKMVEA